MTRRFLAAAAAVTPSTIMAPQLRAQNPVPPANKPDTLTVNVFRGAANDTTRWMWATVRAELRAGGHGDTVIGEPRVKGDTAFVTASRLENNGGVEGLYEFGIEYRFERRGGWVLTGSRTIMHGQGPRPPKADSLDVKRQP